MAETDPSRKLWERLALPGAAVLVCVILAWPVLTGLSSHLLGIEEVDAYGTQWFYWVVHQLWSQQGSLNLRDLQESTVAFHPYGKDIYSHTGSNLLDAFVAIPFRAALGAVAGYNIFCLFTMVCNGWAFSRLARQFTRDPIALWVSSLWFATSPFVLYEFMEGRPTQGIVALLPLFLLQVWRSGLGPGWRPPVLAGVLLAVVGYQYWFYAFFGGLAALAHGLVRAARPQGEDRWSSVLLRHALMAGVALLLCAPAALPLFLASAEGSTPGLLMVDDWTLSQVAPVTQEGTEIGILGFQPWLGQSTFFVLKEGQVHLLGHQQQVSIVALILTGLWVWRPGPLHRGPVLAMLGLLLVVAVGPVLMLGDSWVGNPVYFGLAKAIGFLRRLWWPGRAVVIPCILIGLFGAMALHHARALGRRKQLGFGLVLSLLWAWDLVDSKLLPLSTWDAQVPAGYQCLAQGEPGAIIEVPFGWNQAHLYYQTAHERPMLGGMLESNEVFTPTQALELRRENSWLRVVLAHVDWSESFPEASGRALEALADLDRRKAEGALSPEEEELLSLGRTALDPSLSEPELKAAMVRLSELPTETADWILQAAADSDSRALEPLARVLIGRRPWSEEDRQAVYDLGYRYVVIQKDALLIPFDQSEGAHRVNKTRLRKYIQRYTAVFGDSVYDDRRVSIFAPWGDPNPCEEAPVVADTESGSPPRDSPTASVSYLPTHRLSPLLGPD